MNGVFLRPQDSGWRVTRTGAGGSHHMEWFIRKDQATKAARRLAVAHALPLFEEIVLG